MLYTAFTRRDGVVTLATVNNQDMGAILATHADTLNGKQVEVVITVKDS